MNSGIDHEVTKGMGTLNVLGKDLLLLILSELSFTELLKYQRVNRSFRRYCESNNLWKKFYSDLNFEMKRKADERKGNTFKQRWMDAMNREFAFIASVLPRAEVFEKSDLDAGLVKLDGLKYHRIQKNNSKMSTEEFWSGGKARLKELFVGEMDRFLFQIRGGWIYYREKMIGRCRFCTEVETSQEYLENESTKEWFQMGLRFDNRDSIAYVKFTVFDMKPQFIAAICIVCRGAISNDGKRPWIQCKALAYDHLPRNRNAVKEFTFLPTIYLSPRIKKRYNIIQSIIMLLYDENPTCSIDYPLPIIPEFLEDEDMSGMRHYYDPNLNPQQITLQDLFDWRPESLQKE